MLAFELHILAAATNCNGLMSCCSWIFRWPSQDSPGAIEFNCYSTRYRDGLPLVLKNVSFSVASGESVGIVGRTGSGKSSLTMALYRIIEGVEGSINIDGKNISQVPLHQLRSHLAIIPQVRFGFPQFCLSDVRCNVCARCVAPTNL